MACANSKRLRYKGRFVSPHDPILLLPKAEPNQKPFVHQAITEEIQTAHIAKDGIEIEQGHKQEQELFEFVCEMFTLQQAHDDDGQSWAE